MPARLHHIIACLVVAGALSAGCGGDADDHPDVATSRIAFVSDRDGYRRIYVMNADGSDQHAVSDPSHGSDRWPTWSPAGARIAFTSDQDGQDDIYVIDADGGNRRNITNTPDSGESHPAWSPDGARIAFASDREPAGLYVIDADGGNPMHVSADATNADWSPDGLQFAYFSIDPRGRRLALYWMDADGDNARVVAHIDPGAASPAWSPDNRWIAATTANDTEPLARIHDWRSIVLMDVFGRNQQVVTRNRRGTDLSPTWSPDGRRLAYEAHDDALFGDTHGRTDIHVLDLDDMSVRRLTDSRDYDAMPAWSR